MNFKDIIKEKELELNELKLWYNEHNKANPNNKFTTKYYETKLEELLNQIIHLQSLDWSR
jgi:hypothetical protein